MSSEKVGLPIQVLLLLLESRLIVLNLARGYVDLRLKVARVYLKKQFPLPFWLVVSDPNLYNRTRDPRCDADDVGSDLAIPSPGILDISRVQRNGRPDSETDNDHRN
jgi:hypothetical protein